MGWCLARQRRQQCRQCRLWKQWSSTSCISSGTSVISKWIWLVVAVDERRVGGRVLIREGLAAQSRRVWVWGVLLHWVAQLRIRKERPTHAVVPRKHVSSCRRKQEVSVTELNVSELTLEFLDTFNYIVALSDDHRQDELTWHWYKSRLGGVGCSLKTTQIYRYNYCCLQGSVSVPKNTESY